MSALRVVQNVYRLGLKELWSIRYDAVLMVLIVYAFSYAVWGPARSAPAGVERASLAIIDEDRSALSRRIAAAFRPPTFQPPVFLTPEDVDRELAAAHFTFVLDLPPDLEADVLRGRSPRAQLIIDATAMTQAGRGASYVQQILAQEVAAFTQGAAPAPPVQLLTRARFNPNLEGAPFIAITQLANSITLLALFLAGAALIREREHGTLEHLLVMPLRPLEIMLSKVWANVLVILVGTAASLTLIVQGALGLHVAGSVPLFLAGAALYVFAVSSLAILLATFGRTLPQFALLAFPIFIVMNLLSGGQTPFESMPVALQKVMQLSPSTHFVALAQAVLYRGAGGSLVWPLLLTIAALGAAAFGLAAWRFRHALVE